MNLKSQSLLADKPARERILLTAHDLFYQNGIRATGVDKVIAAAGVTKVTFYRHFPSKNRLIEAFLDYRHQRWMDWFKDAIKRHTKGGEKQLTVLLPVMEEWFTNPIFRGCAFINTTAELADSFPDAVDICRSHKRDMVAAIATLLPKNALQMSLANAAAIAVDGAIIRSQLEITATGDKKTALSSLAVLLAVLNQTAQHANLAQSAN